MKKHLPAVLIFFVLIIVTTYPLVFKITTHIPGFFSSDELYAPIWDAWRVKFSVTNGLPIGKTDFIAYPFGIDFYSNLPIGYLWYFINYSLAILTSPILTYNLQVVLSFFCLTFFTYLLTYYLLRSRLCAVLSGIIFGFSPYIFMRSWQHLSEIYHWSLVLFMLAVFKLKDRETIRTKVLFVLSLGLTSINFTDTFFAFIMLGIFLIYLVGDWRKNKGYFKKIFLLMIVVFIILIPTFFPFFKNMLFSRNSVPSGYNEYHRPFEDLFNQSARQLSYFLPAAVHPLFGKFTEQFVGSLLYGVSFTEHTLYLGWTPLVLAFIAFRKRRKCSKQQAASSKQRDNENFYLGFFVWLAIGAWLFSQPPWWQWGSLKIFMPSFFMYKILPMFRAYCRFGIVVMLAVSVLAGFGLRFILERFRSQRVKIVITTLFCSLVLFEFWNYPPFKIIDISKVPQAYYWLKEQPGDFAIVEYPWQVSCPIEVYKFYQTNHGKKIMNGASPGTYAFKILQASANLSSRNTAGILKWLGAKYVFVHRDEYLKSELEEVIKELQNIPKNPGLKLVRSFPAQECPRKDIMCVQKTGPIDVYEVIALPVKPKIEE